MYKLFFFIAFALTGCASVPSDDPDIILPLVFASPAEFPYGTVVIARDQGLTGGMCDIRVSINGTPVVDLGTSEMTTLYPKPGNAIFSVGYVDKVCSLVPDQAREFEIREDETRKLRVSVDASGGLDISPAIF